MESNTSNNNQAKQDDRMNDIMNSLGAEQMAWSSGLADYKQILEQLKSQDEMIIYNAVINLSNQLSMAQENTLTNFNIDQFIPALIGVLKRPNVTDISNEINMFTVQCLTNLMDIFPTICNSIINQGGVKCLCELLERSMGFIDLNDQCIKAFEKLSTENPYAILTSGALGLSLNMMDFFEHTTQKKIIQTVLNVSRNSANESDFDNYILPIMPCINMILQNRGNQPEGRTEHISTIILRISESCMRFYSPNSQFQKVSAQYMKLAQTGIFEAVLQAIYEYIEQNQESQLKQIQKIDSSQQKMMSHLTIQNLIKTLTLGCRFSSQISQQLIDFDIFKIIEGFLPSSDDHRKRNFSIDSFPFVLETISLMDVLFPEREVVQKNDSEKFRAEVENKKREILQSKDHQAKLLFIAEKILPKVFYVYDNNIAHNIRLKTLQVIDKIIALFNDELLNNFIEPYSFAKFIQTNFRTMHPFSIQLCLQMVNKLIQSNPKTYTLPLVREGVSEFIKKLLSQESIEKTLNLKVSNEPKDEMDIEQIMQAKAALYSSQNQQTDDQQKQHFEQILQKYLEVAKSGNQGNQTKSLQQESCNQIIGLAQALDSKYFGNDEFMKEINVHCEDEYKLLDNLKYLANEIKEEAQQTQFNLKRTTQIMQKLTEYLTSNRKIMCYEFKNSGLLEALELFLTYSPKQSQLYLEQQKAKEKHEELKQTEEMQLSSLGKDGKEISKKEARAFIQRLRIFANYMFKITNGKKPFNELVQLCHDLLSENEAQIFQTQQQNDTGNIPYGSYINNYTTDVNQSVNALRQLTQRTRVNLIYDPKMNFLKQKNETSNSKDQNSMMIESPITKSKSAHPAFAHLANSEQKEIDKSKVYVKRNHLYSELRQVLISVEQCASLWLLEDFLRNKIKTIDDVKSLRMPSSFLDQFQQKSKSKAAKQTLTKAMGKLKEHFDSESRQRSGSEQFAQLLTDEIVNSKELTQEEQTDIIKQLEMQSLQMMDELYAGEDNSLDEMRNMEEGAEERLLTGGGGSEDSLIEAEQRLYEFHRTLEKIKSNLKSQQQKSKSSLKSNEKVNQVQDDEEMEDESEEGKTEELPQKDVEMTDEEEQSRNEIEDIALKFKTPQSQSSQPLQVDLSLSKEPSKENAKVINEDLEELIKANGEDIEFEFYYKGEVIPQNQTIFELIKSQNSQTQQKQGKTGLFSGYSAFSDNVTIYFTIKDKVDELSINRKDSILEFSQKRERTKSEAVDDISVSSVNFIVQQLLTKDFQVFQKDQKEKIKDKQNGQQLEQSLKILKVLNYIYKNIHLMTNQGIQFLVNQELEEEELKETLTDFDLQYEISQIHPSVFHHHKLDSFIVKNIQDPYNLIGGVISDVLHQIFRNCPFLFPFSTRQLFFKLISFIGSIDMNRSIYFLRQFLKQRGGKLPEEKSSIKISRQKAVVDRTKIIESGLQLMKQINKRAFLEIEYKNEVGTGLGPTLEFYNLIAEELKTKRKDIWRKNIADNTLFPAPITLQKISNDELQKVYEIFRLAGTMIAKSIVDDRLIDLPLSPLWWDLLLGKVSYKSFTDFIQKMSLFDLERFDKDLFRIFSDLQLLANKKRALDKQFIDQEAKIRALSQLKTKVRITQQNDNHLQQGAYVEDLTLYFTLPGYEEIELKQNGKNILVTIYNLQEYIDLVMHYTFHETIKIQTSAFKKGFNTIFPIETLKPFQGIQGELEDMICGTVSNDDEWKSQQKLMENIIPANGYHQNSSQYLNFIKFISELGFQERRKLLTFVTGSPRLPHGGFGSLDPKLTVVLRKPQDPSQNPDNDLPSVMTCQNFVKLPPYSSYEVLEARFQVAYNEGTNNFNLS